MTNNNNNKFYNYKIIKFLNFFLNFTNQFLFKYLQLLQLHDIPFHFLISFLKTTKFSDVLMCEGRLFHIDGPKTFKLFVPKVLWFTLNVFRFK